MKKLLLTLSFMALAFTSIKAADNATINATDSEQTVFTENNDQLILENTFGKQTTDKAFLDLSLREIWKEKVLPFIKTRITPIGILSAFALFEAIFLMHVTHKIADSFNYENRRFLFKSYVMPNIALILYPSTVLCGLNLLGLFK